MTSFDASNSYPTVISFNSKDRVNGTNSSFLSQPVDLGVNKYDSVCLMTASIPKSYYNMPTNYNSFTLTEKGVSTPINITVGSYNKLNLAIVLSQLLTAGSTTLGNNWTYVVSNPNVQSGPDTFKFTFTVSGNGGFQPTFTFGQNSPFRQLGFEQATSYTFVANTLVSVNAINLAYILRMFIVSDICDQATDGILAEILSVGSFPPQSVIFFQEFNIELNTRVFNSTNSNSWNFSVVDSFGQLVDFVGVPWAFTLVFYKRTDTHELHKQELMITNEQRLFQIEQAQRKLIDNVKKNSTTTTEKEEDTKDTTSKETTPPTSSTGTEEQTEDMKPIFPVLANYVLPEFIEPSLII